MPKYKNYYTLTLLGEGRHSLNIPRQILSGGLVSLFLMAIFSVLLWTLIDLRPLADYVSVSSQNQLLKAKTFLLYQKNYDLAQRDSIVAQEVKILEAMVNSEDENAIPLNPEYRLVSVEEHNIGWRVFQYKIKIGDRVLYEYVGDRYRPAEHAELKETLSTIQKNIDTLIQAKQFAPEIEIVSLPDKAFAGMVGDLLVFSVSKEDAFQMQMNGLDIAERYKKTLQRELKIAKENRIIQETPLVGSIRIVDGRTGMKELSRQIALCQNFNVSILQKNTELMAQTYNKALDFKNNYARTPSIYPLRYVEVSSPYGYRIHPIRNTLYAHYGLDFATPVGTKVMATADGRVTFAGWSGHYGYMVQVYHGIGISTIYGHCNETLVQKGQWIKKGQVVALSGNTGLSNGPHLHYEVRRWNVAIDPVPYLQRNILTANQNW